MTWSQTIKPDSECFTLRETPWLPKKVAAGRDI
jgi:hypothetical protein